LNARVQASSAKNRISAAGAAERLANKPAPVTNETSELANARDSRPGRSFGTEFHIGAKLPPSSPMTPMAIIVTAKKR